jgi:hypothetical protein
VNRLLAIAFVVLAASPAQAACERDADRLRAHLEEADRHTSRWNLAWTIVFGTAVAGQMTLALTEWNPLGPFDKKYEDTLYVGASKASLGFLSRVIMPLHVDVPPRDEDRCVELAALRKATTKLAKKERQTFFMTHIGGMVLNLTGVAVLWARNDFKTGAISFAIAYPVGITSAYTLPRASWRLWRSEAANWNVTPTPEGGAALTYGGSW